MCLLNSMHRSRQSIEQSSACPLTCTPLKSTHLPNHYTWFHSKAPGKRLKCQGWNVSHICLVASLRYFPARSRPRWWLYKRAPRAFHVGDLENTNSLLRISDSQFKPNHPCSDFGPFYAQIKTSIRAMWICVFFQVYSSGPSGRPGVCLVRGRRCGDYQNLKLNALAALRQGPPTPNAPVKAPAASPLRR
jgi:hypothetical protein